MVIYIHGFGGSGEGVKASLFKTALFKEPVLAPSLSYVPGLAMTTLSELIETLQISSDPAINNIRLIGSSLGGYYALYLSQMYNLKAVLLNPAVYPFHSLERLLGMAPNFYDQSHFEWNQAHLEMLKKYEVERLVSPENIFLLLQQGDEVLDYREAHRKLKGVRSIVQEGGSHSFETIDQLIPEIGSFLGAELA
ncbi:MAG: YqiA/YcfP family alpha/beta fold hydrolase [Campylobacterota bacterium]|nr:YqiA/YcfP family alpha/beta fold hydrolase [Campylobacterota bacterium]